MLKFLTVSDRNHSARDADVAQVVAHLIGSEEVTGPIPVISSCQATGSPDFIRSRGFFLPCSIQRNEIIHLPANSIAQVKNCGACVFHRMPGFGFCVPGIVICGNAVQGIIFEDKAK